MAFFRNFLPKFSEKINILKKYLNFQKRFILKEKINIFSLAFS